jgi:hypothetical protein
MSHQNPITVTDPESEQGDGTPDIDPKQPTHLEMLAYPGLVRGTASSIMEYIQGHQAPEGAAYSPDDAETDYCTKFARIQGYSDRIQLRMLSQDKEMPLTNSALGKLTKPELLEELIKQSISRKVSRTRKNEAGLQST